MKFAVLISLSMVLFTGFYSCSKVTSGSNNTRGSDDRFAIYFFDPDQSVPFMVDTYNYDSTWMKFLNEAPLTDIVITDENIKEYDWEKQQITLDAKGKDIFSDYVKKEGDRKFGMRFHEKLFIVTLNGKRIYDGRVELRFSQMGIRYPIISYGPNGTNSLDEFEKDPVLWMIYYLSPPAKGDPNEKGALTTNSPDIKAYFEKIGKLK